jgi:hypothetical protein
VLSAFALTGCGYSLGYRVADGVVTIAIPIFNNHTFPLRREIEYQLTDAMRREIQVRTQLVLTDESSADMVIYGTIKRFREQVVSEDRFDQVIESNIDVVVELVVEDLRHGKRSVLTVPRIQPFSIERGETFEQAQVRALEAVAQRLVTRLEDWGDVEPNTPGEPADQ